MHASLKYTTLSDPTTNKITLFKHAKEEKKKTIPEILCSQVSNLAFKRKNLGYVKIYFTFTHCFVFITAVSKISILVFTYIKTPFGQNMHTYRFFFRFFFLVVVDDPIGLWCICCNLFPHPFLSFFPEVESAVFFLCVCGKNVEMSRMVFPAY